MGLGYSCGPGAVKERAEQEKARKALMGIMSSTVASILWLQNRKAEHEEYLKTMFDLDMAKEEDSFTRWVVETQWRKKAGIVEEPDSEA